MKSIYLRFNTLGLCAIAFTIGVLITKTLFVIARTSLLSDTSYSNLLGGFRGVSRVDDSPAKPKPANFRTKNIEFDRLLKGLPPETVLLAYREEGEFLKKVEDLSAGEFFGADAAYLILSEVFSKDYQKSFKFITTDCRGAFRSMYADALFTSWSEDDPKAAFEAVTGMPDGTFKKQLCNSLGKQLVYNDPRLAFNLLDRRTTRGLLYRDLFSEWGIRDIVQATTALKSIESKELQLAAVRGLGENNQFGSINDGLSWVNSLDPTLQSVARNAVFKSLFENDANVALISLAKIDDPSTRSRIIAQNICRVAKTDLFLAKESAEKDLSPQDFRYATAKMIEENFQINSFNIFAEMVEKIPIGENRDRIVLQLAKRCSLDDPRMSIEWLSRNSDRLCIDPEKVKNLIASLEPGDKADGFVNWNNLDK